MFEKFLALDNLSKSSPFCARIWAKKHSVPVIGKHNKEFQLQTAKSGQQRAQISSVYIQTTTGKCTTVL